MEPHTHLGISHALCGGPVELDEGRATVSLLTTPEMGVDDRGLVHGGFVFGLADHAAMLAVDDPFVVLGAADVRFLAPVRVGDEVVARAEHVEVKGRNHLVEVTAHVGDTEVFRGTFTTFVLDAHVLESR